MELKERLTTLVRTVPPAQQVGIAVSVVILALASVMFFRWVTAPSFTVLYAGMQGRQVQSVIDELETQGVDYKLEAAGSRILVPRSQVYELRASLAAAGLQGEVVPAGYELLDEQGLTLSNFQQRISFQRALEGELSKTLNAMDGVESATVHLVIPDEPLFSEERRSPTASVLVRPVRDLTDGEVEAMVFLVASSVDGLDPAQVTVADVSGEVLHAAGEESTVTGMSGRSLRQTRDFEHALTTDLQTLLSSVLGPGRSAVVVRADLDFDQRSLERETFGEDTQTLSEQTVEEEYSGTGIAPGAALGADGGIVTGDAGEYDYARNEVLREYGIDREVTSVISAPGDIRRLSVAVIVDDGSAGGAPMPIEDVERLVAAAAGLDAERGDVIEVSAVPFALEAGNDAAPLPEPSPVDEWIERLPEIIGGVLMLGVVLSLLVMSRGRRRAAVEVAHSAPAPLPQPEPERVLASVSGGRRADDAPQAAFEPSIADDVIDLVQRQPEEIATLLRSWLADRR